MEEESILLWHIWGLHKGKITDLYQGDDKNDKWDEEIAENNMRTIQLSIDDLRSVGDQVAEVHPVESLQKE